jgi:arylsulfatase
MPLLRARALLACAALLASVPACQPRPQGPPHVIVVVADTLRPDRLGSYGGRRGLTPFLDELAGRGVRFANAYAVSSWTMPSVASLFTSRYPSQHHVATFDAKLPDAELTFAEVLAEHGYDAAGFTANFHVTQALGYAQGFALWQAIKPVKEGQAKVRGGELLANNRRWLAERAQRAPGRPRLLYFQFMEAHGPYEPPQPFRSRFAAPHALGDDAAANLKLVQGEHASLSLEQSALLASLYDGEVAALDGVLRLLFQDLAQGGLLDNAVVVITADHGEEFGEHGSHGHGTALFDETLRVPLLIVAPGLTPRVVEQPVSLIDLAPTLLELAGVPPPPRFEGGSLVPLLEPMWIDVAAPRDVLGELPPTGPGVDLRRHDAALVRGHDKLLRGATAPQPLVRFDLAADPGEQRPLAVESAAPLLAALQARLAELAGRADTPAETVPLDAATREKLRALGYHAE